MGFFGEIISNERVELPIPDGYILKLLVACLPNHDSSSVLFVQTQNEDNGFALCNLSKKGSLQSSLQHEFGPEDSPIILWTSGDDIHLTGNWIWNEDEVSDLDSDEEIDEESTTVSNQNDTQEGNSTETPPTPTPKNKRNREEPIKENTSTKKQKKAKATAAPTPTEPIIPSEQLVVISKPPSDTHSRPIWKIKPINGEGTLIPSPKQKAQSGVLVSDYVIGHGIEPKLGATVCITYEGLFPNGKKFDANLKRSKPLKFRKGSGQVIRGLDLGIEGMRIGGSREIVIPPALGYGEEGFGDIPGNQTLVFRVTLVGVENKRK